MRRPSRDQFDILTIAAAINAHRNGGQPRAAEPVLAHETIDGPRVAARAEVDIDDGFRLIATALPLVGRPAISKAGGGGGRSTRSSPSRSRVEKIARSVSALCRRGLLVRCEARDQWETIYSSRCSIAGELAREAIAAGRNGSGGFYLTAAGIDAVSDRWRDVDVAELVDVSELSVPNR